MIPVHGENANVVFKGDGNEVVDLWVEVGKLEGGALDGARITYSVWQPDEAERQRIAAGENIKVGMLYVETIPPAVVSVTGERVMDE